MSGTLQELRETALALVAPGKGLLAVDESFETIEKRFVKISLPSTEENRRAYRELFFTTPGIAEFISGIIMFDETMRQGAPHGKPFPQLLAEQGIMPGIKVDRGAKPLAGFPGEKITEGLDGLRERFEEYKKLGARFAKWRAVITIGDGLPTPYCISANAHALSRYAALAEEAGIVPVVEPEVVMDGGHSIEACENATAEILKALFDELYRAGVDLSGVILKTNMVLSGKDASEQASVEEVASATIQTLRRLVPPALPGVAFLSGGQSEGRATANLNAMNVKGDCPWELSFSFARALQDSALKTWQGRAENKAAAQACFYRRAKLNSIARYGKYTAEMEKE